MKHSYEYLMECAMERGLRRYIDGSFSKDFEEKFEQEMKIYIDDIFKQFGQHYYWKMTDQDFETIAQLSYQRAQCLSSKNEEPDLLVQIEKAIDQKLMASKKEIMLSIAQIIESNSK